MEWVRIAWHDSEIFLDRKTALKFGDRLCPPGCRPDHPTINGSWYKHRGVRICGYEHTHKTYEGILAHYPNMAKYKPWLWRKFLESQRPDPTIFKSMETLLMEGNLEHGFRPDPDDDEDDADDAPETYSTRPARLMGNRIYAQPLPLP